MVTEEETTSSELLGQNVDDPTTSSGVKFILKGVRSKQEEQSYWLLAKARKRRPSEPLKMY